MNPRSVLILIWLAFVVRGSFYAVVIPIWEGPDEWAHFAYVHHLAVFGTLPLPDARISEEIQRSLQLVPIAWPLRSMPVPSVTHDAYWSLPQEERARREADFRALPADTQTKPGTEFLYEGKQPPLYYLICVPLLKFAGSTSLATRVLALRILTVLLGSLVVPLAFAIARRVFGKTTPALLATLLLTALPVLSMTVSRIANDALAIVFFSLMAWALLRPDPWDWRGCLLVGFSLGAGFLTKAYFVGCVPILVCAGLAAVWNAQRDRKWRVAASVLASVSLGIAICGWWYVRILGAGGPVWADVTSSSAVGVRAILAQAVQMPWWQAVKVSLDMHFWFVGWSFLFVRSWIYAVLRWVFLLLLLGSFLSMWRNRTGLRVVWGLYAGFWAAMMYHMFVTFMNQGIPSSTGHYLYAVIACEVVILCGGIRQWLPVRWQDRAIFSFIGVLLLLEVYATHFVLIPYYTGLIRHRPDTSLFAFHVSQGVELGWKEILLRVAVNKPDFLTPALLVSLWIAFLCAGAGLLVLAHRSILRVPR